MKSKTLITTLSIAALVLAGCAGTGTQSAGKTMQPLFPVFEDAGMPPMDDDYHPAGIDNDELTEDQIARRDAMLDGSETVGHGTFRLHSMTGAEIEFDLPTSADDEAVQEIEEYRQTMHGEKVTYVVMDVDNRDGTTEVEAGLTVFDEEGNKYEFDSASTYINSLEAEPVGSTGDEYELQDGTVIGWEEEFDLYDEGVELHNKHTDWVEVSERGKAVLVYPGIDLPDEFTRIAVEVGYETEDAYLAD